MAEDRDGIRARLQQLVGERSQSEIARRTGMSVVSVNRYLKGTRVPADFCAALVRNLGVNPAWLLVGEGTPYLADITSDTGAMAGNVLELVEAMNAVARMRLGALTGKHHLRVLRELNDALRSYEELRVRLNTQSGPIFQQLLTDLGQALNQFKTERAADLRKAAEQVARLCDDRGLHRHLMSLQAHDEFLRGHEEEALKYQRNLLLEPLTSGSLINEDNCHHIYRMVLTLDTLGRLPEALRVCEATLALADPAAREWDMLVAIEFLHARLMAKLGDLNDGLGGMMRCLPRVPPQLRRAVRLWILPYMLFSNVMRPHEAFEYGDHIGPKAIAILRHAAWLENAGFLRRALDYLDDPRMERMGDLKRPAIYESLVLRAIEEGDKAVLKECDETVKGMYPEYRGAPTVYRTQLTRLVGTKQSGRKLLLKAAGEVAARPVELPLDLTTLVIHHHNAIALTEADEKGELGKLRREAIEFFDHHVERGFHAFAPMLDLATDRDATHAKSEKAGNRS